MSDLVKRLRDYQQRGAGHPVICDEAADEIERLHAVELGLMQAINKRCEEIERLKEINEAQAEQLGQAYEAH